MLAFKFYPKLDKHCTKQTALHKKIIFLLRIYFLSPPPPPPPALPLSKTKNRICLNLLKKSLTEKSFSRAMQVLVFTNYKNHAKRLKQH